MLERLAAVRHALLYAEEPLQGAALRFDALAGVADVDDALTMSLKVRCLHAPRPGSAALWRETGSGG